MQRKEIRGKRWCSTKETKRKGVEEEANKKGKEKDMHFGKLNWMREGSGGRKVELRRSRRGWAEAGEVGEDGQKQ